MSDDDGELQKYNPFNATTIIATTTRQMRFANKIPFGNLDMHLRMCAVQVNNCRSVICIHGSPI